MTFDEALSTVKLIAGGRDWSITHAIATFHDPRIHVYIADPLIGHCTPAPTYRGAVDNLLNKMGLIPSDPPPEVDRG